ncbi:MAG: TetR family transcriptional regulator [Ferrovum sp.]|jgi:AcrR family transcriptional regulator|uniref:TetR/AcrR family transcriptional regulator n=1 Tax=Ferrovum sp. TaxID=2609467 RepID=UPI00261B21C9|nr:TetR/AcrR family transcriptional regulator [Ferrovum sp.]MBW8067884.1 TetR family transcriptional regulator [Ferrovum sp.]
MEKRNQYHHGNLEQALIEAAVSLIAQHGVAGFSLREAAAHVGVSPSAAYRHFSSKEDLLNAVALDGFQRLALQMEHAMAEARTLNPECPALAAFQALGLAYVTFAVNNPPHFQVMFGIPFQEKPETDRTSPYQLLQTALDDLVGEKVLAVENRSGAELYAWSVVHGLAGLLIGGAIRTIDGDITGIFNSLVPRILAGLGSAGKNILRGSVPPFIVDTPLAMKFTTPS